MPSWIRYLRYIPIIAEAIADLLDRLRFEPPERKHLNNEHIDEATRAQLERRAEMLDRARIDSKREAASILEELEAEAQEGSQP